MVKAGVRSWAHGDIRTAKSRLVTGLGRVFRVSVPWCCLHNVCFSPGQRHLLAIIGHGSGDVVCSSVGHARLWERWDGNLVTGMERATISNPFDATTPVNPRPSLGGALMVAIGLLAMGVLGGCLSSGDDDESAVVLSPREAAEELIAGPLAAEVGLGALTASCPEMNGAIAGDVFPCTAATETQWIVNVDAAILAGGQLELTTTNVITADALSSFELAAVNALNAKPEISLGQDAIDCGESSVVLADDRMMICALTDPTTLQVFDISLTIDDIETRQFGLVVADRPRS